MKYFLFTVFFCACLEFSYGQPGILGIADPSALVSTDKCMYKPGDTVTFSMSKGFRKQLQVRYKSLNRQIAQHALTKSSWQWKAPGRDYTGYLVELFISANGKQQVIATIAVDVSSDWKRFPRYGFVSYYPAMTRYGADRVVADLNRFHINGLQFYDWQYKHHKPLAGTVGKPDTLWTDIGGREIHASAIREYIRSAHERKMKTMFYDLAYGTYENAEADGVSPAWYLYADPHHGKIEKFELAKPPFYQRPAFHRSIKYRLAAIPGQTK